MFRKLLLFLIGFYRLALSPLLPNSCRFQPSCSSYAREAVEEYGAWKGGLMAVKRILRCHPFNPGGYDPVIKISETKKIKIETGALHSNLSNRAHPDWNRE